jgi:transcriptional regulator with XRE-family HTH domain
MPGPDQRACSMRNNVTACKSLKKHALHRGRVHQTLPVLQLKVPPTSCLHLTAKDKRRLLLAIRKIIVSFVEISVIIGSNKMKQEDDKPPFNRVLKTIRKRLGLTQEKFAGKASVSASTIYSYEAGRMQLSDETFRKVRDALIQALADAARAEREERERKLAPFKSISDQIATSYPELSSALEEYCVGAGGAQQQKSS